MKCRVDTERPHVDVSGRKLRSCRNIRGVRSLREEGNGKAKRLNLIPDAHYVQFFLSQQLMDVFHCCKRPPQSFGTNL